MKNIVGNKYNMLTVLEDLGKGRIICRCDCGNVKEFIKGNVTNGHTKSCGCKRVTAQKSKLVSIVGKKFGRLTVIEELGGNKIKCRCECGNMIETYKTNVIKGITKSCGCLQKEKLKDSREKARFVIRDYRDHTGERFGKLTVVNDLQNDYMICRCDCGNVKTIKKQNVLKGLTISCGCVKTKMNKDNAPKMYGANIKDVTGMKFNMLTVLEDLGNNKIKCRCECGNIIETYKNNVVNGITKSCGCIKGGK